MVTTLYIVIPKIVLENQVQPLHIATPDGETLYAWHIVPIAKYIANEDHLINEHTTSATPFQDSVGFDLLSKDPNSRLVINCSFLYAKLPSTISANTLQSMEMPAQWLRDGGPTHTEACLPEHRTRSMFWQSTTEDLVFLLAPRTNKA